MMARAILRTISSGTGLCWVRSMSPAMPHMAFPSTSDDGAVATAFSPPDEELTVFDICDQRLDALR
jgi:hypothetical protein